MGFLSPKSYRAQWYHTKILGIEFDLAQLKRWNRKDKNGNGVNDKHIKALELALNDYRAKLNEIEKEEMNKDDTNA